MTPETRRAVFRYGIAIDLVIVATGVAMLAPPSPTLQIVLFTAAVAISTWKGGWTSGLASLLLSVVALAFAIDTANASQIVAFAAAAFAAGAIVHAATAPRVPVAAPPPLGAEVLAFTRPAPVDPAVLEQDADEWHEVARSLERTAAQQLEQLRLNAERERREEAERAARQREAAERAAQEETARRADEQRRAAEEEERARAEAERRAAEERERAEAAKATEEIERLEAARAALARELEERLAREREEAARELQARVEAERRAAEEELRRQLEAEKEALRVKLEQQLAAEREAIEREAAARVEEARRAAIASVPPAPAPAPAPQPAPQPVAAKPSRLAPPAPKKTLFDTVGDWLRRVPRPGSINLVTKKVPANTRTGRPAPKPSVRRATAPGTRKPRVLMIERRRGSADVIMPRLRNRAIEVEVVERWVDAVDEMFRFKPDVLFLDVEHPDFDNIHRTLTEKTPKMPIVLTGRSASSAPAVKHAAFAIRPFDVDALEKVAHQALSKPEELLAMQILPRTKQAPSPAPKPSVATPAPARTAKPAAPQPAAAPARALTRSETVYEVDCFSCRTPFDAIDADWCSCLAKERTLVCTNCLSCFCKAPPAFKEKFWVEAPPRLFERKTAEARRQQDGLPANVPSSEVARPLVLTVEDDAEIQAIVQRICSNLGYGFIHAMNGQDGLELAHEYRPNLILSDAFMPKLDGREMCRQLKQDPSFADTKMIVMTGLYTDTKYRSEALKRFHVDEYLSKPVAVTDLINVLQKHLEGVTGLPAQEDLHELHRAHVEAPLAEEPEPEEDVTLAEVLAAVPREPMLRTKAIDPDRYEVCCFNCQNTFDAAHADWCSCVGRDQTVVCAHCGGCFCKAPAAYKERFWMDAPPTLFERKMLGSKRNVVARENPAPTDVKRPLILLVEDDENVQLIVRTVVTTMGYGFVVGANGQEGLTLAREYSPDLILSDAFMPKLDGREMCRLLKEDPTTARTKAIIMTGLYTDRKYRNEALDYFKVDDYVAKPLAVDDLIKLFKKHLPQEVTATM
jgi:CheY-like chemotaxis protein